MKRFQALALTFSMLFFFIQFQEISPNEQTPRFKKWLQEEVVYIITTTEREVFNKLETDREREMFIEAFWEHRDPTPSTPENEFKNEHFRRIRHVNQFFSRRGPGPGWRTDQGRIYILIGEPRDIDRVSGDTQIYNSEIWFYQGLSKYGLPDAFYLVFYQKGGVGEYDLYSPLQDGPQALMISYFGDPTNYQDAYRTLRKINPRPR